MSWIIVYAVALVVFLGIDAIWLNTVMKPLFEREVGDLLRETMRLEAAAGFYALYVVGILYFCVWPGLQGGSLMLALFNGAVLGFLAYGTYEATNMTTLRGWTWSMVFTDTAWGMALTALTAGVAYGAGRWQGIGG